MSVLNLVLLSITPLLGFAVLVGMGRFERLVLDEHPPFEEPDEAVLEVGPSRAA